MGSSSSGTGLEEYYRQEDPHEMTYKLLLLSISLGAMLTAPSSWAAERSVLITNVRPVGAQPEQATLITQAIAAEVSRHGDIRVITSADLDAVAKHDTALQSLDCDAACLADLTALAHADDALSGTLGQVGNEWVLTISLVDGAHAEAKGSASRSAQSLDALVAQMPVILAEAFGWQQVQSSEPHYTLPEGKEVSFAVLDVKPLGLTQDVGENLTQVVAVALKHIEGTKVISRSDINSMLQLESQKDELGCADDMSCLAEVGGALGVEKLLVGDAGLLGNSYVVNLRLIDVRTANVDSRVNETFQGVEDQLLPAIRTAVRKLVSVSDERTGAVAISSDQVGAELYVGDELQGELPMPAIEGLPAGRHSIRVQKSGYLNWHSDVYVEPGATTPLWASLEKGPTPLYQRWYFWTALGAVVAGGVTTTVVLLQNSQSASSIKIPYARAAQ